MTAKPGLGIHDRRGDQQLQGRLACVVRHVGEENTAEDLPIGLPPVDHYSFYRILPHPYQWVRVRWWAWRLRRVLTPAKLAIWTEWQKEWRP